MNKVFKINKTKFFLRIKGGYVDTLYSWSALNTEEIGKVMSDSLAHLIKTYPIEKIHLIGKFERERKC